MRGDTKHTSTMVAHRLSTVVSVDEIIVLDKGRIVERGTHKQLYANVGGVYHKLCTMQNFEN